MTIMRSSPGVQGPTVLRLSAMLLLAGVLAQISYPLLDGTRLRGVTTASVVLLCGASLADAADRWGARVALRLLVVAGGVGLLAEWIGVHTGFPFGAYAYTDALQPQVVGVPVIVPLAWTMLGYPALLLGRHLSARLGRGRLATAAIGAVALASWDLFLDPQMVAAGNWVWFHPSPALPGVPDIPLTNYAGWLLVSLILVSSADACLPHGDTRSHAAPATLLAWTWVGSMIGNLAFFDRPWVALYGGVAMGLTVGPYLWGLLTEHRAEHQPPDLQKGRR